MKINKTKGFHIILLIIIAISIVFSYWDLPQTFFQQDEWQTFAANIYHLSRGFSGVIESFLPMSALSHFAPFARVFSWFEYMFYKTNFTLYALQSISLHILNTLLLYYFVFNWFRSKKIAFISALFFGVNSVPSQAVTWVVNTNSYEAPTLFILVSLLFFQKFLIQTDNKKRNIIIFLSALFTSLLFHENGIFLLLFYPIIILLHAKPRWKKLRIFGIGLVLFMFVYVFIRVPFFFGFINPIPEATDISRPPIAVYPYRAVSIGLKSFAGSLFPERMLIGVSEEIVRLGYPQFITPDRVPNPFIAQSIVFDLISYAITIFIFFVIIIFIRLIKEKTISQGIIWSLIFIPLSLFPYGFVLGKAGYASILDPKFYYVASIGLSILVGLIVYSLFQKYKGSKLLTGILVFLFAIFIFFHVSAVREHIVTLEKIGLQRKKFLDIIKSTYKNLPQKVIFYIKSDTVYYGMPDNEKILPVQIGFGKMLMIWYQREEKFPGCLFNGNFLLDLLEEGYRYCEGRGFGSYRNYDKLVEIVAVNKIMPDEIVAYSWKGQQGEFIDITQAIRHKIKQDIGETNETN